MKTLIYATFLLSLFSPRIYPVQAQTKLVVAKPAIHYYADEHFTLHEIDKLLAGTENPYDLRELISCESENTNVARMDSNHLISFGILQFNGTATWQEFSALANVKGSPMNPPEAIKVADWMISHGYGYRWTCWKIQGLSN